MFGNTDAMSCSLAAAAVAKCLQMRMTGGQVEGGGEECFGDTDSDSDSDHS